MSGEDRLESLIANLVIPEPWDLRRFVDTLAEQRGKPIALVGRSGLRAAGFPCGLLAETEELTLIVYEERSSRYMVEHTVLHEIGHLLLDHEGERIHAALGDYLGGLVGPAALTRLETALARGVFGTAKELEAEAFANLIMPAMRRRPFAPLRNVFVRG
ncbi:ImmA/IrrE family metallo-endopeptidase [Nocardia yunnanensis]|uniref:ImmA/IrrE family metallo-endopeptidase n=1 Tax=Nocardia yunnanensis TaxID=2382165 RepID=A0A386ZL62_9NOCA|nr:ImmA/IrrE family metallo-endopeptidase [Nocardia yunnanensis]AYF77369.1 ImmA/IrrE family metallo-endopeptidase [Nocardia yunnanensis]